MLIGLGGLGPKEIVVAIVALCVVIIVHELGHFLAAIWTGMKVDRFSVFGIGPSILKLGTWRGTEFVIGAIPFGAYVLIQGMEPEDPDAPPRPATREHSSNFRDKPLWARMTVIAGGPVANYLLAILLLLGIYTIAGVRGPVERIAIDGFAKTSAAQTAGLQVGDELVKIGDTVIDPALGGKGVNQAAKPYLGQRVEIVVRRDGELVAHPAQLPDEGQALGVGLFLDGPRVPIAFGEALRMASTEPFVKSAEQLVALGQLFTGKAKSDDLRGPVYIVEELSRFADRGLVPLVSFAALISTALGLFNLLPLPALDGGRLAFLGYEAVARRRANPRIEELVHGYGMLALLALILWVTVGDVRRLF